MQRWASFGAVAIICCYVMGCGGDKFDVVPVTGKVTLDGQPLADATINFTPQVQRSDPDKPLPGSYGRTDAEGRFELRVTTTDQVGARVGTHRVVITAEESEDEESDEISEEHTNPVPERYNTQSELTFDVPAGGSDQANFELTTD